MLCPDGLQGAAEGHFPVKDLRTAVQEHTPTEKALESYYRRGKAWQF